MRGRDLADWEVLRKLVRRLWPRLRHLHRLRRKLHWAALRLRLAHLWHGGALHERAAAGRRLGRRHVGRPCLLQPRRQRLPWR